MTYTKPILFPTLFVVFFTFPLSTKSEVVISTFDNLLPSGFNTTQFVTDLGYTLQIHENIQTEDGYLLNTYRIAQNEMENSKKNKAVVFFMHGMATGCESFLIGGVNKSLPLILVDAGYDVWLGNARGTTHSQKHKNFDVGQPEFWDYSWHEIGLYDLPANINYILNYTNQSSLYYIGHSQGGTSFFVMTSLRPEMNKHIKLMIGLAPGVFYGTQNATYTFENFNRKFINVIKDYLGIYSVHPNICNILKFYNFCTGSMGMRASNGAHAPNIDETLLKALPQVIPDSFSIKQVLHYSQIISGAEFKYFDYDEKNMEMHGSDDSPMYDLRKATVPVVVFYAGNDTIVTPTNTERLIEALPNVKYHEMIKEPKFGHIDLLFHKNIDKLVYWKVVEIINNDQKDVLYN